MKKLRFGKTGLLVSRLAFGGIPIMRLSKAEAVKVLRRSFDLGVNFIDTAHVYSDSEEKIGEAIKGKRREDFVIASKSPATDKKTFLEHLDLSLKRLDTDYVDIYQHHNIATEKMMEEILGPNGAYEGMKEAMKAGKIRHPGFSSHSVALAIKLMKSGHFEAVQLPINFIDTEAEKEALPLAKSLDIGFIGMKPLGGGLLEDAGTAMRYLLRYDQLVPDPGIERIEEIEEMVSIVENVRPLSGEELGRIEALRAELGSEWCHRCDYCQPCPQGIRISTALSAKSIGKRMSPDRAEQLAGGAIEKAKGCVECRICVERCPYKLDIPRLLKKSVASWEERKKAPRDARFPRASVPWLFPRRGGRCRERVPRSPRGSSPRSNP